MITIPENKLSDKQKDALKNGQIISILIDIELQNWTYDDKNKRFNYIVSIKLPE